MFKLNWGFTLTGARDGHTNGCESWPHKRVPELATLTGARAGQTNGWHGPQAGSRLRLGWQALVYCRFRTTWGNFWAGKLCFLSLNVVYFFGVFSCGYLCWAVCCAIFCDQIIREVVHFLCSFCWWSCEVCCAIFCDQIIREVVHFLCSFCWWSCGRCQI